MCGCPSVSCFSQLIASLILCLRVEHARCIIDIIAITELEDDTQIEIRIIKGIGQTAKPRWITVTNDCTVCCINYSIAVDILVFHHSRFNFPTRMKADIRHSGLQHTFT